MGMSPITVSNTQVDMNRWCRSSYFEEVQNVFDRALDGKEKPVKPQPLPEGNHALRAMWIAGSAWPLEHWQGSARTMPTSSALDATAAKNGCELPFLPIEQVEADVERLWTRYGFRKDLDSIRTG